MNRRRYSKAALGHRIKTLKSVTPECINGVPVRISRVVNGVEPPLKPYGNEKRFPEFVRSLEGMPYLNYCAAEIGWRCK